MSEMPFFGRTSIYIVTLLVFVLLQLAVIFAKNFGMLLAFRFITGFIGSPVSILQNLLSSFLIHVLDRARLRTVMLIQSF